MREAILSLLRPVRLRQRWQRALGAASLGLLLGSLGACLLRLVGGPAPDALAPALLLLGPLAGAAAGWLAGADYGSAARAVDRAYGLKDCTLSALEFAARPEQTPFHELTARDALRHLGGVRAGTAAPLRLPRSSPWAAGALVLALFVLLRPGPTQAPAADLAAPPETVLKEADLIEGYAKELEKMGEEEGSPELKKLAAEMRKKAEEMRQPGVDVREAIARISELQMALSQLKSELNAPLVDGQLKELGSTLREAPPLEQAGKALQESQLDQATRLLEALAKGEPAAPKEKGDKPGPKDERASRAAGEKTAKVAKDMAGKKLDRLSKAADKLAAGLSKADDKQLKEGAKDLADEVRQQERRKRINQMLAKEDRRLQDCKSECEKDNILAKASPSGRPKPSQHPRPGEGPPKDGGQPKDKAGAEPSRERGRGGSNPKQDGKNTGRGANDRPNGPGSEEPGPTTGDGAARGDGGPSRARVLSPEEYRKLRKLSEAAIEDEAIPLGMRESIRKYFELLRPPSVADDAPAPTAPPK